MGLYKIRRGIMCKKSFEINSCSNSEAESMILDFVAEMLKEEFKCEVERKTSIESNAKGEILNTIVIPFMVAVTANVVSELIKIAISRYEIKGELKFKIDGELTILNKNDK